MRQKGFTLIELMVVISIMAILGTLSIAGFKSYNQVQSIQASTSDVISMLSLAKSRAQSQVKPPIDICNGTLDGYKIEIRTTANTDSIGLKSKCGGVESPRPLMIKILPKNVKFTSSADYFFPVQTGGVDHEGEINLAIGGKTRTVTITKLGIIGFSQPAFPTSGASPNSMIFPVGTSTWNVPSDVSSINVEVCGGGSGGHGGGNPGYAGSPPHPDKGGAGGNSGINNTQEAISVSSGQALTVTVGIGGSGGDGGTTTSGSGSAGGQSSITGGGISIVALGGAEQSGYVSTVGDENGGSGGNGCGSGTYAISGGNAIGEEYTTYGGSAGVGFGAGGGGGATIYEQSISGGNGGKGANGVVIISW
jgi:prepilin-type N-terminal cleavage/methylation domain-containing protein